MEKQSARFIWKRNQWQGKTGEERRKGTNQRGRGSDGAQTEET